MKTPVIVAKMYCSQVGHISTAPDRKLQENVKLSVVYSYEDSPNKKWASATPSGSLELTISNPEAFGKLEPGKQYLIHITPATSED